MHLCSKVKEILILVCNNNILSVIIPLFTRVVEFVNTGITIIKEHNIGLSRENNIVLIVLST